MVILSVLGIIVATIMPALIWLFFFLKEDVHPEPKKLIVYVFGIGALVSLPVLLLQISFQNIIGNGPETAIFLVIGLAFIEEFFKFIATYFAIHNDPAFDEPVDAMIYMITAALGFATVENFFIIGNTLHSAQLILSIETLSLRFVGATLLHALASATVGYYWARGHRERFLSVSLVGGVIFATGIHTVFNYLVLRFQDSNLLYPTIFLIIITVFILADFEKLKRLTERDMI
jgi:protease PrsW